MPLHNIFPIPLEHLGLVYVSHPALRQFSATGAAAAPEIASPRAKNFVKKVASPPMKTEKSGLSLAERLATLKRHRANPSVYTRRDVQKDLGVSRQVVARYPRGAFFQSPGEC